MRKTVAMLRNFERLQQQELKKNWWDDASRDRNFHGVWTPILSADSAPGGVTYHVQSGSYVRIGSLVHVSFDIQVNSLGAGGAGSVRLVGLPFVAANTDTNAVSVSGSSVAGIWLAMARAQHLVFMRQSELQYSQIVSGSKLIGSITYQAA